MRNTLLVASNYLPPICGGAEWAAWEVTKRIADRYEVHLITTSAPNPDIKKLVEVHRVPRSRWMPISYSSIYSSKVRRILKEVSPDLIHCHMTLPWGYILRNERTPKVITCHGAEARKRFHQERYFIRSALKHATVLTTPSKWMAEFIRNEFGQESITIPNGVDTGTFKPIPGAHRSENAVLFVGRFIKNKGVLDLVEAARELSEYEFWFVGSSTQEHIGRRGIEIPRGDNVKVIEFIDDRNSMAAQYNEATICAFPSQYEAFPLVGLEAMACGRSVVATRGPRNGFSDYLENGREGILVTPHDIKGLVDAIRYLMQNKSERDEFEKNAIKKAAQYDWGIIAERYTSLLEHVMHR